MKKRGRPPAKKQGCLNCYSFNYKRPPKGRVVPPAYQLCWQCYKSLKDSSTSAIKDITGKQYLQVYDSWFVKNKDWDIEKIEVIRTIKERILFNDGFLNIVISET